MGEGWFILQLDFKHPTTNLIVTGTFGPFESQTQAEMWAEDASMDISWFRRVELRRTVEL